MMVKCCKWISGEHVLTVTEGIYTQITKLSPCLEKPKQRLNATEKSHFNVDYIYNLMCKILRIGWIDVIHYRLIARASRTRKSRYSILPPCGTRARYMSRLIRHNALPFMGNFCARSAFGWRPSDSARFVSQLQTSARVQSRGSAQKKIILSYFI